MKNPTLFIAILVAAAVSALADVEVQFAASAVTVKQGEGTLRLPVILYNNGGSDQEIQLQWPATDGTAKVNVNYRPATVAVSNVTIPSGATIQVSVPVRIILAQIRQNTFFRVSLVATGSPSPQMKEPTSMVVNIQGLPKLYFVLQDRISDVRRQIRMARRNIDNPAQREETIDRLRARVKQIRRHMRAIAT
jgi:hypothetical protein